MTGFGTHNGETLTVDLSDVRITSREDLWDAIAERCATPSWFGRNLDAWWDTIEAGGISEFLDSREYLHVVLPADLLALEEDYGHRFLRITNESTYASAEVR